MRLWTRFAFATLFVPLVASAQFRDLDASMANLERGFGAGDVDAIVSGIGASDQVMLQFPGLAEKDGFFGRDQASYFLDQLFNKVKPSGFERVSTRSTRADGQFHIKGKWTTASGTVDLYMTLKEKEPNSKQWVLISVRSGG